VASLQWGNSIDQCSYSFLGVNALGHDLARSVNDLHTALCNTFGVQGTFGNPAYASGPLTQLYG
jgi:hypothetical protein